MNPLRKAYYVARYLGPGFVGTRLRLLFDKKTQRTRRLFASCMWDEIDRELPCGECQAGVEDYAQFKRQQAIPFFFPLGRPPHTPGWPKSDSVLRTPTLAERIDLLGERRVTYFLDRPSPSPIASDRDWYQNPFDGREGRSGVPWHDIPDFTPDQGDPRMLWEPSRASLGD